MSNKLRTFKLIDRDGFINNTGGNEFILENHLVDGCFQGYIDSGEDLVYEYDSNSVLILRGEFQFFKEVFPEETLNKEYNSPNKIPLQGHPTQEAFSEGFFDKMSQRIKEDCIATRGALCVDENSIYFLWEEDEYLIEDEEAYQQVIDSIKMLTSVRK